MESKIRWKRSQLTLYPLDVNNWTCPKEQKEARNHSVTASYIHFELAQWRARNEMHVLVHMIKDELPHFYSSN